jgi:hypothetical protein
MPFPKDAAAAALIEQLMRRIEQLLKDFADDLDDLQQEQFRAAHQQGFEEAAHTICHADKLAAGLSGSTAEIIAMKKSDAFPTNSKYFKANEFPDEPMALQVEIVRFEDFEHDGKPAQQKPVVYFIGQRCGLVIGLTQWDQIAEATGEDDTDNWKGRHLELFKATTISRVVSSIASALERRAKAN